MMRLKSAVVLLFVAAGTLWSACEVQACHSADEAVPSITIILDV